MKYGHDNKQTKFLYLTQRMLSSFFILCISVFKTSFINYVILSLFKVNKNKSIQFLNSIIPMFNKSSHVIQISQSSTSATQFLL